MDNVSKNKIKEIKSLQQKKFRDELGLFVIEGVKMVEEAIRSIPNSIQCLVHTSDYVIAESHPFPVYLADSKSLVQCSSLQTPNKVLIVVKQFQTSPKNVPLTIVLDGIQDPGNMGTILRLADWFGVQQLICSTDTVDLYNPKVVQASMGAILRIPVTFCNLTEYLKHSTAKVYGALLEGKNIYKESLSKENAIILMGNEGKGISDKVQKFITHPITIPKFGEAESLNVSIATGIILSEFFRG